MFVHVFGSSFYLDILIYSLIHNKHFSLLYPYSFNILCLEVFSFWSVINDLLVLRELLDEFFSFMCMLCRSLFVLLSFLFFPLCCLSFIDLWILITPLVSSNSSSHTLSIYIIVDVKKSSIIHSCLSPWQHVMGPFA